jgi:hypothetical protein
MADILDRMCVDADHSGSNQCRKIQLRFGYIKSTTNLIANTGFWSTQI